MVTQLFSISPLATAQFHAGTQFRAISHPPHLAILDVETQLTFQHGNTSATGKATELCPCGTWKHRIPLQLNKEQKPVAHAQELCSCSSTSKPIREVMEMVPLLWTTAEKMSLRKVQLHHSVTESLPMPPVSFLLLITLEGFSVLFSTVISEIVST